MVFFQFFSVPESPQYPYSESTCIFPRLHIRVRIPHIEHLFHWYAQLFRNHVYAFGTRFFLYFRHLPLYNIENIIPEQIMNHFTCIFMGLIGKYRCADPLFLQKAQQMGNTVIRRHVLHAVF